MEISCKTCRYDSPGIACVPCDSGYSGWEPKTWRPVPKTKFKRRTDMEKSCETCGFLSGRFLCGLSGTDIRVAHCEKYKAWKPKGSDILARGAIDRAFTEFTDKLKGCDPEAPLSDTQKKISEICDEIKNVLLEKNRKYGDSALNPKRVFSKASPIEQINVRLDDKLSRIMSAQDDDTEDAELDLIGYLILKRVAKSVGEGK